MQTFRKRRAGLSATAGLSCCLTGQVSQSYLISEVTYYVSNVTLNPTHSLTRSLPELLQVSQSYLISEVTYYVSNVTLNPTHSLAHSRSYFKVVWVPRSELFIIVG